MWRLDSGTETSPKHLKGPVSSGGAFGTQAFLHPKHLYITVSQDKSPASGGSFFRAEKNNTSIPMKLTIEVPKHYYDINTRDPASLILEVAHTDWKEFAFDMADVVERALEDQIWTSDS